MRHFIHEVMDLFLIDAIGPFFHGYRRKRINWSKIPFMHLTKASAEDWRTITDELRRFAREATAQGYNAVTLDDLAHLAHHPLHEPEVTQRICILRKKFTGFFNLLQDEFGLRIYLTSDVLPTTPAITAQLERHPEAWKPYYHELVCQVLDDFPQLSGLILRIGESDGQDVTDPIRSRLHLRNAREANAFLRDLLPEFERREMDLIFRTWTVGAHPIGDLMWHRATLAKTLRGLDSPRLIVSMKHGESDFFRYLPLNRAFLEVRQRKIIEFQARREYEGAGEYPSFIGWDCERIAAELATAEQVVGISVWCQTGGWHRFRRRAFLEAGQRDLWIRLNTAAAISVFKHHEAPELAVERLAGPQAVAILRHADTLIRDLLYIPDFARQQWFFRRVRIPPILHVYWDSLFINHGARKLMRLFIRNTESALQSGEQAALRLPEIRKLAESGDAPIDDIRHMCDFFHLLLLARRYYFLPYHEGIRLEISAAKKSYKQRWPDPQRRYRIKVSFKPFPMKRRSLALAARIFLRSQRAYRTMDRLFLLRLGSLAYRLIRRHHPSATPKFLRKSAMGIDALFR